MGKNNTTVKYLKNISLYVLIAMHESESNNIWRATRD